MNIALTFFARNVQIVDLFYNTTMTHIPFEEINFKPFENDLIENARDYTAKASVYSLNHRRKYGSEDSVWSNVDSWQAGRVRDCIDEMIRFANEITTLKKRFRETKLKLDQEYDEFLKDPFPRDFS